MIIYKCAICNDEMFSDIYKIKVSDSGIFYEVEGKTTTRSEDFDERLIGANASAEEVAEGTESSCFSGVDIVLNHNLESTVFNKETYKIYIKKYMKTIKEKLEKTDPDRVKPFMTRAQDEVKKVLSNFKNYQFYTGKSMDVDGMVGLLDYREDGSTPFMLFFKDGLVEEKC